MAGYVVVEESAAALGCDVLLDEMAASRFRGTPTFALQDFMEMVGKLARGKAGSDEGALAEFLAALPPEVKMGLAAVLCQQIEGECRGPGGWSAATMTLIPKHPGAAQMAKFRPITVLPVLQKVAIRGRQGHISP